MAGGVSQYCNSKTSKLQEQTMGVVLQTASPQEPVCFRSPWKISVE